MIHHCCHLMTLYIDDEDMIVLYVPKFRQYGIQVLDGGSSYIEIKYCPWCGSKLPESLRDRWLEELEKLGLEFGSPEIPEKYKTDLWWNTGD